MRANTIRRQVAELRAQMGEPAFTDALEQKRAEARRCGCSHTDPHDAIGCTATWTKDGRLVRCGCLMLHAEMVVNGVHELVPA